MTIRKKWILTLGMIAIISIAVNSIVLSILINHYFNNYLDITYEQTSNQIVHYLTSELEKDQYTQDKLEVNLDAYLDDSIEEIRVYDTSGAIIAEAGSYLGNHRSGMSEMMHEMMGNENSGRETVDQFLLTGESGDSLGEVHITRYSTSADSYAAQLFQDSLFRNSMISIGIVLILVLVLGLFMSKRVSRDLITTADIAQSIDMGNLSDIQYSTTKEILTIQRSLESLGSRLKLKQTARKTLVDEMVHQTRTPLTILKMHIEGMEDGVIDPSQEDLKVCENQVDNLTDIITNISSLIDVGNTERPVDVQEFELYQFIKQIANGMKGQFQKKEIQFNLLTTERIIVVSDRYRLGQSIYNILTNAYKFTSKGGLVTLDYKKIDHNISIVITDTGSGMSREEQNKIFKAYYTNAKDSGSSGDGIGLYIVRENMQAIKGNVIVESEMGKGSSFTLIFPIILDDEIVEENKMK